jgi:hypothetical protein
MREGKLFLAETAPQDQDAAFDSHLKLPRREHFWAMSGVPDHFTLRFDHE